MLAKAQLMTISKVLKPIHVQTLWKNENNDVALFHRTLYEGGHIFIQKQNIT